jgi:hypothetical protein
VPHLIIKICSGNQEVEGSQREKETEASKKTRPKKQSNRVTTRRTMM